jgi:hypothetical protein
LSTSPMPNWAHLRRSSAPSAEASIGISIARVVYD